MDATAPGVGRLPSMGLQVPCMGYQGGQLLTSPSLDAQVPGMGRQPIMGPQVLLGRQAGNGFPPMGSHPSAESAHARASASDHGAKAGRYQARQAGISRTGTPVSSSKHGRGYHPSTVRMHARAPAPDHGATVGRFPTT